MSTGIYERTEFHRELLSKGQQDRILNRPEEEALRVQKIKASLTGYRKWNDELQEQYSFWLALGRPSHWTFRNACRGRWKDRVYSYTIKKFQEKYEEES